MVIIIITLYSVFYQNKKSIFIFIKIFMICVKSFRGVVGGVAMGEKPPPGPEESIHKNIHD